MRFRQLNRIFIAVSDSAWSLNKPHERDSCRIVASVFQSGQHYFQQAVQPAFIDGDFGL